MNTSCHAPAQPTRFPDFSLLSFDGRLTEMITAVIITHFHLDHCAALPYFTEVGMRPCPLSVESVQF